jgi:cytokinin dehydrogenase
MDGEGMGLPDRVADAATDQATTRNVRWGLPVGRRWAALTAPAAVLRPVSAGDVVAAIRWAGRQGWRIAARGEGHSVWGRAQAAGGLVVDMSAQRRVHTVQSDRVAVAAGARWSDVLAATLPCRLTPPVLTDYLELSVAGTVVVGGIGATTFRHGAQCDNVIDMDVVTGAGDLLTCSAADNADLFDAMRAGLGQAGVITRLTLALVPAPERVWRVLMFYPDLATMLHDARLLAGDGRFDAVQGAAQSSAPGPWTFRLDAAKYITAAGPDTGELLTGLSDDPARREPVTMTYGEYLRRLAAFEAASRSNGQWYHPHPWLATFLGDSTVDDVAGGVLAGLDPATGLGQFGQVGLSPIRRAAVASPLLQLPAEGLCHAFNLIRMPGSAGFAATEGLVADNRAVYEQVRAAGGTLYPVSALPMTVDDWRRHFGPAYGRLARARRRFDPLGILTPGYEIFASEGPI